MALLILSFIAGVLTVAAPCILPLLPVIIGGSLLESSKDKSDKRWLKPLVVAGSLAVSVIIFTLLLKATTMLLGVPQMVWQIISGLIVLFLGLNYLWPHGWEKLSTSSGLFNRSNALLGKTFKYKGLSGAVLIGAALGPVFSSCSPTYALIVAAVLPASFVEGLVYLIAYALGMSGVLLLIAYLGQAFTTKLQWLGTAKFKQFIGILFILIGVLVLLGYDKKLQTFVLDRGWYDPISSLEKKLAD